MAAVCDQGDPRVPAGGGEVNLPGDGGVISRWTEHLAGQDTVEIGQRLPPHSPDCAGCGPRNPAGLDLQVVRTATGVEAVHRFSDAQVGAPGIAHGGAVALAFDDLFGFALYTVGSLAVTRSLTIEYHAPFRLHRPYTFSRSPSAKDVDCYSMLTPGTTPARRRGRPRLPSWWSVLDILPRAPNKEWVGAIENR